MGSALLRGWVAQGTRPLVAIEPFPNPVLSTLTRRHGIGLYPDLEAAGHLRVGACVVALKPQVLRAEAHQLAAIARQGALMLSIAAGTGVSTLRRAWGRKACIVRAMPNIPGSIGHGISALYAPTNVVPRARMHAQSLLMGLGDTVWVKRENLIDAATAVSGSGPAYVFLLAECLERAARDQGIPAEMARRLARATISGAGAMLGADSRDASELRRDVTSPGGTTEAALRILMHDAVLEQLLGRAVAAARARASQLRQDADK
jgi:pyrroline-5-carboxylate reductase